jgi:hypothetical protein
VRELTARVQSVDTAQQRIAEFLDQLPEGEFDRRTFRPRASMPLTKRRALDALLYRYQHERNGQELAKSRLLLVQEMQRKSAAGAARTPDVNPDLLLGQMFGALDRIRLQMSADLLFLESFLGRYARSIRTHEILLAFQRLVEMQGGLGGPSQGLASVMDWLQTSTFRRLRLDVDGLSSPGVAIPRAADLLREAYLGARPASAIQNQEMSR